MSHSEDLQLDCQTCFITKCDNRQYLQTMTQLRGVPRNLPCDSRNWLKTTSGVISWTRDFDGKSVVGCALALKSARKSYSVQAAKGFRRASRLEMELQISEGKPKGVT